MAQVRTYRKAGEKQREFKKSSDIKPEQPVCGAGEEGRKKNLAWVLGAKPAQLLIQIGRKS